MESDLVRMNNMNQEAEKIYKSSMGSEFFMAKQGVLDKYKSYYISEEQEKIWSDQLINDIYNSLQNKDNFNSVRNYVNAFYNLSEIIKNTKSYDKIDLLFKV